MLSLINSVVFVGLSGRKELLFDICAPVSGWNLLLKDYQSVMKGKKIVEINEDLPEKFGSWILLI